MRDGQADGARLVRRGWGLRSCCVQALMTGAGGIFERFQFASSTFSHFWPIFATSYCSWDAFGHFWPILANLALLAHYCSLGHFWLLLDHFGCFWPLFLRLQEARPAKCLH
eukprot:EG_transcript_28024